MGSPDVVETFRHDVRLHRMTVEQDDGLRRHLKFRGNRGSVYWFDLVTWPGVLVINGDMGTYAFARIADMFEFFRRPDGGINAGYWAEKLLAADCSGRRSVKVFDQAAARAAFAYATEDWHAEARRQAFAELDDALIEPEDERGFREFVDGLEVEHAGHRYRIGDFWEHDLTTWDWAFLWNLHAISWGIGQYDAAHAPVAEGAR